jgi:2-oxoisovalerate dehydrogenase E1 component
MASPRAWSTSDGCHPCPKPQLSSNVLIVDETRRTGGVAEALMALLTERTQVPHARLTAQDSFIATGPAYGATMPSCDDIVEAARNLVKGG